ncbi:hypothetical protein L207DRAFT_517215 [Hyaloscypha variabilis F]|uniref:Uncharacterized protein n=1 Tax=Hyaloscypha variabilis (strain UAMH 11265 / GT02V1 / F) TaxID=1149755 RepID=A0A2J6R644_HYAVF|nr:hypothetical protein L207DRAFT_517215 [Hyaloscypha variabilis F]
MALAVLVPKLEAWIKELARISDVLHGIKDLLLATNSGNTTKSSVDSVFPAVRNRMAGESLPQSNPLRSSSQFDVETPNLKRTLTSSGDITGYGDTHSGSEHRGLIAEPVMTHIIKRSISPSLSSTTGLIDAKDSQQPSKRLKSSSLVNTQASRQAMALTTIEDGPHLEAGLEQRIGEPDTGKTPRDGNKGHKSPSQELKELLETFKKV